MTPNAFAFCLGPPEIAWSALLLLLLLILLSAGRLVGYLLWLGVSYGAWLIVHGVELMIHGRRKR